MSAIATSPAKPGRPRPISTLSNRDLEEALAATARRMTELFAARYGTHGLVSIMIGSHWIGGRYSDGSFGWMLQFEDERS